MSRRNILLPIIFIVFCFTMLTGCGKGSISVTPAHTILAPEQQLTFQAAAKGGTLGVINWSSTGGEILANGTYEASADSGVYHVLASSATDPSVFGAAIVEVFSGTWGTSGTLSGQFSLPMGIVTDSQRKVYVCDHENGRVQVFSMTDTTSAYLLTIGAGTLTRPAGIAMDKNGVLYIADFQANRIHKYNKDGTHITSWGTAGTDDGQFNGPVGIAVNSTGQVFVADSGNHRIQKFASDGTFITKWGSLGTESGKLNTPYGLALDADGNVFVAEYLGNRIQKFTSAGTWLAVLGSSGSGKGQMKKPASLWATAGQIFVADSDNDRIQVFTTDGQWLSMWGSLDRPCGVAVDSSGFVYVSNTDSDQMIIYKPMTLR